MIRQFILDGSKWKSNDDVYDAFFKAVGAPPSHGRNFDALIDSIEKGQINAIEVPYRLVIHSYDSIGSEARKMANDFVDLIHELAARGCRVEIVVTK
ncbi:MAG: barstar family protein [Candidatus Sulfotelmatobacter sp.]